MPQRRNVALLVETSNAYSRGLLDGVIAYVKRSANWSIFLTEQERGADPPKWLARWQGDGQSHWMPCLKRCRSRQDRLLRSTDQTDRSVLW